MTTCLSRQPNNKVYLEYCCYLALGMGGGGNKTQKRKILDLYTYLNSSFHLQTGNELLFNNRKKKKNLPFVSLVFYNNFNRDIQGFIS